MIENKITIKDNDNGNVLRAAMEHRATWTGLTYTKAREAGCADEVEKIIRDAIVETGKIQGNKIKTSCPDPESIISFTKTFLDEPHINAFEMTFNTITEDNLDMEFHYCPLLKAWQDLGFDDETCAKLCDMAMDGDRNIAKTMGYDFHLGDTIADGCKTCKITFSKKLKLNK